MDYKCYIPQDCVLGLSLSDNEGWLVHENLLQWLVENKIKHVMSFDNMDDDHLVSLDSWLTSGHVYLYDHFKPYIEFENANDAMIFRLKFGGGTDAVSFHEEE